MVRAAVPCHLLVAIEFAMPAMAYTGSSTYANTKTMTNDSKENDGSPKFGRLLVVLVGAVLFCAVLTWVMGTYFPNFPG